MRRTMKIVAVSVIMALSTSMFAYAGDISGSFSKGGCTARIELHAASKYITGITVANQTSNISTSVTVTGYEYNNSDPSVTKKKTGTANGAVSASKTINPDVNYTFYATATSSHSFSWNGYSDSKTLSSGISN